MPNQYTVVPFPERFWAKVEKTETCWLFRAYINRLGYGSLAVAGKIQKAHRVSWELRYGPIPPGLCVLHKCDIRHCVNPEHLFLGTQIDNIADMVAKNRQRSSARRGETNPMSKLTEPQVHEIRALHARGSLSQHKLAAQFNVAPMTINRIVNNKMWRHV